MKTETRTPKVATDTVRAPAQTPRPPSPETSRAVTLRAQGATLREIGEATGVTGEAVRLTLSKAGDAAPSSADVRAVRAAARHKEKLHDITWLADANPHMSVTEIAKRTNAAVSEVRDVIGKAGWTRPLGPYAERYAVDAKAAAEKGLAQMAALCEAEPELTERGLAAPVYDARRGANVSSQRLAVYFGTWSAACRAAGVKPLDHPATGMKRAVWSDAQLWEVVGRYVDQADFPSFTGLRTWLAQEPGTPSMDLMRRRLGPWTLIQQHFAE